jgi:hypothetical protein
MNAAHARHADARMNAYTCAKNMVGARATGRST